MIQDILNTPVFQATKQQAHHGPENTLYDHSVATARLVFGIGRRLHMKGQELAGLTRAALLHDFFGYDWHGSWYQEYRSRYHGLEHVKHMHAMIHGEIAADRARMYFNLSPHQCDVISSHMFPLANHLPHSRDAWILTAADKVVATREMGESAGREIQHLVRHRTY